ncbi:MAG: hypothetical protein GZ087_15760 [Flavobacterium sp.]|nr:hypothetical protein [Flavobacterium sp.]
MKNYIPLLIFLLIFNVIAAQNTGGVIGSTNDLSLYLSPMQSDGLYVSARKSGAARDETQYLFPQTEDVFQIFFVQNKGYSIKNLNYNINSRKIESIMGKDSVFQFDSNKIDYIKHSSKTYKFYNFNEGNQLYQELFASNKILFLKGFKLIFKDAFINPMTNAVIAEAKYEKKEKYFGKVSGSDFTAIDLKKKSILKLLGDKSSQVDKYVSDSKLSYTSEDDLIKIFIFYNTL